MTPLHPLRNAHANHRTGRASLSAFALRPLAAALAFMPLAAFANCVTPRTDIACDENAPNPWTATVGLSASNVLVEVLDGAIISTTGARAIDVSDDAFIRLRSGSIVRNSVQTNTGTNVANTIQMQSNSVLEVAEGALIETVGQAPLVSAVYLSGVGNTIVNIGTIRASAVDSTGIASREASIGTNFIDNTSSTTL